jgi:mRNA-degrading endonuclease RelE of RelBE toxin-antitoxin system
MADVVLTPEAVRDIRGLPSPIVARMEKLIARLRQWPHVSGVKSLRGSLAGRHRLRTGDYRLQFRVEQTRKIRKLQKVVKGRQPLRNKR